MDLQNFQLCLIHSKILILTATVMVMATQAFDDLLNGNSNKNKKFKIIFLFRNKFLTLNPNKNTNTFKN